MEGSRASNTKPRRATEQDLEEYRPLIEQYYKESLPKVMEIMESRHGLKATDNMYKKRIRKWGLDKKNKEPEMKAIIRIEKYRSFQGKRSLYRIRGRPFEYREAVRYWKRKRMSTDGVLALCKSRDATPEALECFTPPPSPNSAPAVLSMPEHLLKTISDYCHGSFDADVWYSTGPTLGCFSIKDQNNSTKYLARQLSAVETACWLFDNEKFKEGGECLISSTKFTKEILLAENPITLPCLVKMINVSQSRRRPEICTAIMRHIVTMGETILCHGHPIPQIINGLLTLASHPLEDVLRAAQNCLADSFESRLGSDHTTTLFVRYPLAIGDLQGNQRMACAIREDITRCEALFGVQDVRCLDLHLRLASEYSYLGWFVEAGKEGLHLLQVCQAMGPDRPYTDIYSFGLALLSETHFGLDNVDRGEAYGKELIAFDMTHWGHCDPDTQFWMKSLEINLRRAGRRESAKEIEDWRTAIVTDEDEEDTITP